MSKTTILKSFLTLVCGVALSASFGFEKVQASVEFFPEWNPPQATDAVYQYNATKGIYAIPVGKAGAYQTTFAESDDGDAFLIEDTGNNLMNHVINDTNAILGYAWSNRVGWLAFSHGTVIDNVKYYPYFGQDADGNQEILKGFIWSGFSGWIQLSSEGFENDNAKDDTNWGVVSTGAGFSGRAWGPALGWIDFSNVTYDSNTGKFGGFACSANDCTEENNKIYFDKVPEGITNAGNLVDWGVSKNMTSINDTYSGGTCELLSGTGTTVASCAGVNPTTFLEVSSTGTGISVNFVDRLAEKGNHDLKLKLTNRFGQTYEYENTDSAHVPDVKTLRLKSVVWPLNCYINLEGEFVCDAPVVDIVLTKNEAIADGTDTNVLEFKLLDDAVNRNVINFASSNILIVNATLNFNDQVKSNQLGGSAQDAVSYSTNSVNKANLNTTISLSDVNADVDGVFKIDLASIAPTTEGNILELLNDVDIAITLDEDADSKTFDYEDLVFNGFSGNLAINFQPAVLVEFAPFNLIENTPTEFEMILKNQSTDSVDVNELNLSAVFDGANAFLDADMKARSESPTSSAFSNEYTQQLQLVAPSLGNFLIDPVGLANGDTKILSEPLAGGTSQILKFSLKPYLWFGDVIDTDADINFATQVAYELKDASNKTYHDSQAINLKSGLITNQIDIRGLASGESIHNITTETDKAINVSGSMSFGEISEEIRKNVAEMTRNETAGDLTSNPSISTWNADTEINAGKSLYYAGDGTLTIDGLSVADNQGSIVVVGGNVYIKGNITYGETGKGSFGLIVMKDSAGKGGNVYIDPSVTNLVGGYYAEGAMMSAQDDGDKNIIDTEIFDGFSSDKIALNNQLFIHGTLISRNTIGGSRQDPVEFPDEYDTLLVDVSCGTEQKCAERFDLNYMRNFATSGSTVLNGGIRADGTDGTEITSDSAVAIKYDPRIQSNIPPGFEMRTNMDFKEIVF